MFVDAGQFYLLAVTPSSQCTESLLNLFTFVIFCISGKGFAGRGGLYLHTKIHTKDYPHQCETCHKRFPTKQRLNDHLKSILVIVVL